MYWFVLRTHNQRVGGSSLPTMFATRQGILSAIVSLSPGVVNAWAPGINLFLRIVLLLKGLFYIFLFNSRSMIKCKTGEDRIYILDYR